jgi:putative transposase
MGKALVVYNFEEAIKKLDLTSQKVDYPLSLRRSNLHNKRVVYPESVQQKAMARYRIAKTWLQQKNCSHMKEIGENLHAFVDAYNMGAILKNEYQFAGKISRATLYRWIKDLDQNNDNWECLVDNRWKKDYQINLTVAEQAAFLRCYCNPAKLTIKMSVQAAKWMLHEHGIPSTAIPKTFSRFLEKYKKRHNHIIVYAREGKKACLDKCLPYITRDVNQLKVGDVLVADGHKLNFFIQHPQTKRPVRMILIVFFDWRSRYPMGWQIVPTENVVGIQAAFFNACVFLGKYPTVVYIDNGRAFKAKVFTETNPNLEHLSGLYVRLNVQFICARAYMGRSKLVERMFRTMNDQCVRVLPSFCGANIADKPAWMHRDEKFHKKMHAIASGNYVPTMFEASSYIGTYFDWYVNQPHEGLDGDTPNHIAVPGLGPGIDPSEISYEFLWRKEVTPCRCEFDFYRMKYTCDELLGYTGKAVAMYDKAETLYVKYGMSIAEVSRLTGISVNTLERWSRTGGEIVDGKFVSGWRLRQKNYQKKKRTIDENLFSALDKLSENLKDNLDSQNIYAAVQLYKLQMQSLERAKPEAVVDKSRIFMDVFEWLLKYFQENNPGIFQQMGEHLEDVVKQFKVWESEK